VTAHLNTCVQCAEAARTVEAENLMLSEALATEFAAPVPTERLRQRVEAAVAELHHARCRHWPSRANHVGVLRANSSPHGDHLRTPQLQLRF
jgi:hypothetical protein